MERSGQAQQLLIQGQELCVQGQYDGALDLLRKAQQMDERNSSIRSVLLERLAEQARRLVDSDWRAADRLAQEALHLDPGYPIAKSIAVLVEDLKRQEAIDELVTEVRRSQGSGDLREALAHVESGLSLYPREQRLRQLRETIRNEIDRTSRGQNRQRDLAELQRLDQEAELAADPGATRAICRPALDIASQYPEDREIESLAVKFRRRLETIPALPDPRAAVSPPRTPRTPRLASIGGEASPSVAPTVPEATPAAETPQEEKLSSIDSSQTEAPTRPVKWASLLAHIGAAATLLVLCLIAIVLIVGHRKPRPSTVTPPPQIQVTVNTDPAGALVRIDHQDYGASPVHPNLTVGTHSLEVTKQGYQPVDQRLDVRQGVTVPPFTLSPLPLKVQVLTGDLAGLKVQWDDEPSGDIQGNRWEYDSNDLKPHTLSVSGSRAKAQVSFDAVAGAIPTLNNAVDTKNVEVVTVSSFGGQAHLDSTVPFSQVTVDGQNYDWKLEGVDLSNLVEGNHTLSWLDEGTTRQIQFETGPGPELAILLFRETNTVASAVASPAQPQPPPQPLTDSKAEQIHDLQNKARDAYMNGHYSEPPGDNAIEYSLHVLQLNPDDSYVKPNILDRARHAAEMQINDALAKGDLATARHLTDALVSQLPDDAEVQALQRQVSGAEQATKPTPAPPEKPTMTAQVVYVVQQNKYQGIITIVGKQLKFAPEAAAPAAAGLELSCSQINVKDKGRFLRLGQRGFRIFTHSGKSYEFLSPTIDSEQVMEACKK